MKWCMNERCWIDLKCLNVCCGWDLNYAKKNDKITYWLVYRIWRKHDLQRIGV
jgi:hypothetical protein